MIKGISEGNERSFKVLFDLYYPHLYRFALYWVRSGVIAEEVVSDVFYKIWNRRAALGAVAAFEKYLYIAVRNQCFTYLKQLQRMPYVPDGEQTAAESGIEYKDPERQILEKELIHHIQKAIEQLPPKCKMIFRLVKEEGLKYREVASLLDVTEKTVENQMLIAFKKLKDTLQTVESC